MLGYAWILAQFHKMNAFNSGRSYLFSQFFYIFGAHVMIHLGGNKSYGLDIMKMEVP